MRPVKLFAFAVCALCAILLLGTALAEVRVEAELGYDNTVTYTRPVPLRIRLKNDGPDAAFTVAVNLNRSARQYDRYEYPVILAGGAEIRLTLPVTITYKQAAYTVEVLSEGELVASATVKPQKTVSPDTLLVGLLTSQPQSLRYMNISEANDPLTRGEVWQTLALTAETFPEDAELLSAFRFLAVDDFDLTTLSEGQRAAFDQWLRAGGVVFAGGGSTGISTLKGLMKYTGIVTGTPFQASNVDRALIDGLSQGQFSPSGLSRLNGSVMLSELRGSRHAVMEINGAALLDRCPVDAGVIYTAAFSLTERPLSSWNGMNAFWQRVLLTYDQTLYQRIVRDAQNYYDNEGIYVDQWLLRQLSMKNPDNVLLIVLLTAGFVIFSGIGSYLILKKLDKREWMWVTVPALSLVGAVITLALSRGMELGKPALAAYARVQVDENGQAASRVMAGVASASRTPITVSVASGERIRPGETDYGYYYDDEDSQREITPTLRYTFTAGDQPAILLPAADPWSVQSLTLLPEDTAYPIQVSVWWEQDGLHGTVENGTDLTLEPGYLFTLVGYCRVPALQPGERADIAILENPNRKIDPNSDNIYEGEIVQNTVTWIYNIVNAAIYNPDSAGETAATLNARSNLIQYCMNTWSNAPFRYVTFSDQVRMPQLTVNGEPIRRAAFSAVIDVQARYRAVGESGVVKLTQGMIPAYYADIAAGGVPVSNGMALTEGYFSLRDEPVFCFALGEVEGLDLNAVELTRLTFSCESYGSGARLQIYDQARGAWRDLQTGSFPANIDPAAVRECLDGRGQIFLRVAAYGSSRDGEIYNPSLSLEGRVK